MERPGVTAVSFSSGSFAKFRWFLLEFLGFSIFGWFFLGFRVGSFWSSVGVIGVILGFCQGYVGIMEKKMETSIVS